MYMLKHWCQNLNKTNIDNNIQDISNIMELYYEMINTLGAKLLAGLHIS